MSTPSIMLRSVLGTFSPWVRKVFVPSQRRLLHEFPSLHHEERLKIEGIPDLFSPRAFNIAWIEYQKSLVEKLNTLTAGREFADKSAVQIAIVTSRQADLAPIFNYASQAYNNHFFFDGLSPVETSIPDRLVAYIPGTFSSSEAMKTELLATAEAMFGAGWVWLVVDMNKRFRVLCTYNAGTPFGLTHRRQGTDMNTGQALSSTDYETAVDNTNRPRGTQEFIPLLNINCWEHAWLTDFGIMGKRKYLESWWTRVDWEMVSYRLGSVTSRPTTPMYSEADKPKRFLHSF